MLLAATLYTLSSLPSTSLGSSAAALPIDTSSISTGSSGFPGLLRTLPVVPTPMRNSCPPLRTLIPQIFPVLLGVARPGALEDNGWEVVVTTLSKGQRRRERRVTVFPRSALGDPLGVYNLVLLSALVADEPFRGIRRNDEVVVVPVNKGQRQFERGRGFSRV